MRANSDELLTRLDWLPLHLEVKVNICLQMKRINVRSPGYMSDLLVNERNNRNNSLNLVYPRFKRETGGGVAGGTYIWCEGNKIVEYTASSLKKIKSVDSFKRP